MVLVKAGNHGFYQYRSGCVYFSLSGVNTVEAGYPGIPRSKIWVLCSDDAADRCLRIVGQDVRLPQTPVAA